MKALKITIAIITVLVVVVLILGAILPKEFHVERSVVIEAPASQIMPQLTSLRNMQAWSPWAELDTNMTVTYEGTDGEVGSLYKWEGNKDVGKGMQEITAISEDRVDTKLTFLEPMESESTAYLQLEEEDTEGEETRVIWGLDGEMPFPFNVMMLFKDIDGSVGKDYEKGLAKLKERVEILPKEPMAYRGFIINEIDWEGQKYLVAKATVAFADIGNFYKDHLRALADSAYAAGIEIAGNPSGIYYSWNEENKTTDMAVAIPVAQETKAIGDYTTEELPPSKALHIAYYGAYDASGSAHNAISDYAKEKGLDSTKVVLEEYVTDPMTEPDTSKWLTNIFYLVE